MRTDPPELLDGFLVLTATRIGLILFAFDNLISVLHDQVPNIAKDELNITWPSPEYLFMAATEVEWQGKKQLLAETRSPWPVSVTVATLLCSPSSSQSTQLPDTLMGRFVLLHC